MARCPSRRPWGEYRRRPRRGVAASFRTEGTGGPAGRRRAAHGRTPSQRISAVHSAPPLLLDPSRFGALGVQVRAGSLAQPADADRAGDEIAPAADLGGTG